MSGAARPRRLNVINPGFDRYGLNAPSGPEIPFNVFLHTTPQGTLEDSVWPALRWWESPLQAEAGIKTLATRPFLHLTKNGQPPANVTAQQIYPATVLDIADDAKVKAAANSIATYMRQGRELYTAAGSAGVTDLSTPLLYYYGALALAKAATTAVFGVWIQTGERHGLILDGANKPSVNHPTGADWPTVIIWQHHGMFSRFYQAARWDTFWQRWPRHGLPGHPLFHVLECLRYLDSPWGVLPPTGFAKAGFPPPPDFRATRPTREKCLLVYRLGGDLFMCPSTPVSEPVFQLPNVVLDFMLLHYFSALARYHTAAWQGLLGGAIDPEGYIFRVAFQNAAGNFLREVRTMLPIPGDPTMEAPGATSLPTPLPPNWLDAWYEWPEEHAP